jgi:hypothetical protein
VRRHAPLSVILLSLASCATSTAGTSGSETVRVIGAGGAMTAEIHPTDESRGGEIAIPVDRAWAAMRAVYDSLRLPVATVDPTTHMIESPTLRLRRRLGDTPLSRYLRCGNTQVAPSADTYEVQLLVRTTLRANDAGTTAILTLVNAEARPVTISADYARCASTGKLEARIVELTGALVR